MKQPSDRSIRGALTTLNKANLIFSKIQEKTGNWNITILHLDPKYLSPKKSLKKRMPKQKKVICLCSAPYNVGVPCTYNNNNNDTKN